MVFQMGRKRWIAALLVVALLGIQAGCGGCGTDAGAVADSGIQAEDGQEAQGGGREDTEEDQVTGMGRYMESTTALPEGNDQMARTMALLDDGSLAYFDGYAGLHVSTDGGKTWEPRHDTEGMVEGIFEKIPYMTCASISPGGSVGMVCMEFSEEKETKTTLVMTDAEGNGVSIPGNLEDGDYLQKVFWRKEKELYGVSAKGRILLADRETGELKELFSASDAVEMLAFMGDRMLLLENQGVEIYDLEDGKPEEQDAVLSDFCRETFRGMLCSTDSLVGMLMTEGEDIVYVVCRDGVFRHVMGGTAMEEFVDGRFCTLNDTRKSLSGFLGLTDGDFLLLTTGEELVRLSYDPDEPTVPERQLVVYSLYEMTRIRQAISVYQKKEPSVWVDYEVGIPSDSAVTVTDALKNLNMELLGGNGPDVLVMDGMDEEIYREKGMLADLTGFLDSLTEEEEIMEPVQTVFRSKGEGRTFPAAFQLPMLCGRTETLDRIKDLSSLADAVESLEDGAEGSITGRFTAQQELSQLLAIGGEGILKGRELDEEALRDFLAQAKRIHDADQRVVTRDYQDSFGSNPEARSVGNMAEWICVDVAQIGYGLAESMLFDMGSMDQLLGMEGYGMSLFGDGGILPVCNMAISSTAGQPELAEGFLRVMFSGEIQGMDFHEGFPVNRAAFERMCSDQDNQVSFGGTIFLPDGTEREFGARYPSRETTRKLEELVGEVTHGVERNVFLEDAILTYGPDVLAGRMGIEEGADAIAKAVAIYLAE